MKNDLLLYIDRLHTTARGDDRIRKNLQVDVADVIPLCRAWIIDPAAVFERRGKNWYVRVGNTTLTVNAHSFTVITAHKEK